MARISDKKLLIFYNTAPLYRTAIFRKIDETYDCDWYFGKTRNDIKSMDTSVLKNVKYVKSIGKPNKLQWQFGLVSNLFKKKYQTFLILADSRSISVWVFLFLAHLLFPKKRIYTWGHGYYGKESKMQLRIKNWMHRRMTGVFLYGNYAKELMIKQGFKEEKIHVIHNSLDYDKQLSLRKELQETRIYKDYFKNDYPTLIFIGRLTPVKQLDMLIEANARLKAKGMPCNIVLVGDGAMKTSLQNLVKEKGLENNIWFYGACYDDTKNAELIYNADLCVSPGNVGLTAMHTLVFGTPVITHDDFKWQMPEFEAIIAGKTGDFYKKGDIDSLTDTIQNWLLSKRAIRSEVRNNCFSEIDSQWTPNFQIEVIKKHLVFD